MLLGSDFLATFGAKLDFGQRTLAIGDEVVIFNYKPSNHDDSDTALARSQETVSINPRSVVFIPLVLPKCSKDYHVLTPIDNAGLFLNESGLKMPNMLIDKNSGVIRVPPVNETGKS